MLTRDGKKNSKISGCTFCLLDYRICIETKEMFKFKEVFFVIFRFLDEQFEFRAIFPNQ